MVNYPHAAQSDNASEQYAGQGLDKNDNKGGKSRQDSFGGAPQFHGSLVENDDHRSTDEDKTNLLPQRPIRPRRCHKFGNLFDRPGPDKLNEMKDRRHALLEKLEYLI